MVEEDDLLIEFKDDYSCPFCSSSPIDGKHLVCVKGIGDYQELLCDACGETLAYQKPPEDKD